MDAREKLQIQIDGLFANAPVNRAIFELKEELLANSLERFEDLTSEGMSPEDAIQSVVGSIGNVDDLLSTLPDDERYSSPEYQESIRRRRATYKTIAIALYFLAGVVFFTGTFLADYFGDWAFIICFLGAIVICIVPTCLQVYSAHRWPSYKKQEDTVVENFKEFTSNTQKSKSIRGAISALLWCAVLILYFLISFGTSAWYITWIIFIIGGFLEALITLLFRLREWGR